jgi:hypothetical protein
MDKVPDYNIIPDLGILTPSQIGLIEAGKIFAGAHVCESEQNQILMAMASRHARYQAEHQKQGHQLFSLRVEELYSTLGQYKYAEIASESWLWQAEASMLELGTECFKCWRASPGHWGVASVRHKYFGGDFAKGKNNIWYSCIITAD